MKYLLYAGVLLLLFSCSPSKKTSTAEAKASGKKLEVRILNSSKLQISKLTIDNGADETFTFENIAPGKKSAYQPVTSLCRCGHRMDVEYREGGQLYTVSRSCANILPCTDYFKGRLTIEAIGIDPKNNEINFEYKQP